MLLYSEREATVYVGSISLVLHKCMNLYKHPQSTYSKFKYVSAF